MGVALQSGIRRSFILYQWPVTVPLGAGVVLGVADALLERRPRATSSMRLGIRLMAFLTISRGVLKTEVARIDAASYTTGSKLLGSVGGCVVMLFVLELIGVVLSMLFRS